MGRILLACVAVALMGVTSLMVFNLSIERAIHLKNALLTLAAEAGDLVVRNTDAAEVSFAAGMVLGWTVALWWLRRRLRARSLLLIDPRRPDMPFLEGVDYVRLHGGAAAQGDSDAAKLIVDAASRGRLSMWERAPSNMLRRVPGRQLRKVRRGLSVLPERMVSETGRIGSDFSLLRDEVERMWPRTPVIEGSMWHPHGKPPQDLYRPPHRPSSPQPSGT